jgi:hypothetical protein
MRTHAYPSLPPFCTPGADGWPNGPAPGTPESRALAAWEVLTGARLARSAESGRMSLLGRYRLEGGALPRDRVIWIALHAFEGARERWECRLALKSALRDSDLTAAIIQEMGGPSSEPDEMTELGFWLDDAGFCFDSRGPAVTLMEWASTGAEGVKLRSRRLRSAVLVSAARRILRIAAPDAGAGVPRTSDDGAQLCLL